MGAMAGSKMNCVPTLQTQPHPASGNLIQEERETVAGGVFKPVPWLLAHTLFRAWLECDLKNDLKMQPSLLSCLEAKLYTQLRMRAGNSAS